MDESRKKYNHGEAFMLMTYRCDTGCHTEMVWNSRDGVTPFGIQSRDKVHSMTHIEWRTRDIRAPHHTPQIGDRIFVSMTEDRARTHAITYVDRIWNDPKLPASRSGHWPDKQSAVDYFADKFYREHGEGESPDLIAVDRAWLDAREGGSKP